MSHSDAERSRTYNSQAFIVYCRLIISRTSTTIHSECALQVPDLRANTLIATLEVNPPSTFPPTFIYSACGATCNISPRELYVSDHSSPTFLGRVTNRYRDSSRWTELERTPEPIIVGYHNKEDQLRATFVHTEALTIVYHTSSAAAFHGLRRCDYLFRYHDYLGRGAAALYPD